MGAPSSGTARCVEVRGLEVERVQMLLGQVVPRGFEPCRALAVGAVRDRRRQHPVADRLAVVLRLELGLQLRDLLGVLAGELAEVPLAAEAKELAGSCAPSTVAPSRLTVSRSMRSAWRS